ncbi:TetR family transcriptional regulator [Streptomyces tateyamensis]|uniref:TetR family transcriptional regulator n=1 Tax=Streptomyces tateyamensis TaxID=565073 RepID=A0A2V4NT21_9ACTN|nr:TetR/AcrR family transcriptional regulator [Streptomyces tateyamensis]PYC83204.1 TetR family transcriptional regulator [Streptomyces tateyamensis]
MSPRGVAIAGVRERLFDAAERILGRDGPGALTSRAVTSEAGCAKGILHSHFTDLDDFVAQLVLRRFQQLGEAVAALPALAGEGVVGEHLTAAALLLLDSPGPALAALALTRPAASARIREAWERGAPSFDTFEDSLAAYLRAEQQLGRVPAARDCGALALAVAGTTHHLLMTAWPGGPEPRERIRQVVAALMV